jgi:hypothetical protein
MTRKVGTEAGRVKDAGNNLSVRTVVLGRAVREGVWFRWNNKNRKKFSTPCQLYLAHDFAAGRRRLLWLSQRVALWRMDFTEVNTWYQHECSWADGCERAVGISRHFCGCCNPLNAKLNPICHLLALLGAHHILHVSRIKIHWKYSNLSVRERRL